jgi:hypothetical protein
MPEIKVGKLMRSAASDTQVLVIKTLPGDHLLTCGGAPMLAPGDEGSATLDPAQAEPTLIGKRYVNAEETFEALCTKAGAGSLSLDGVPLAPKQAKALPSSD